MTVPSHEQITTPWKKGCLFEYIPLESCLVWKSVAFFSLLKEVELKNAVRRTEQRLLAIIVSIDFLEQP